MEAMTRNMQLAAGHGTSGVLLLIVGVVIVALLIAAFAWGLLHKGSRTRTAPRAGAAASAGRWAGGRRGGNP